MEQALKRIKEADQIHTNDQFILNFQDFTDFNLDEEIEFDNILMRESLLEIYSKFNIHYNDHLKPRKPH